MLEAIKVLINRAETPVFVLCTLLPAFIAKYGLFSYQNIILCVLLILFLLRLIVVTQSLYSIRIVKALLLWIFPAAIFAILGTLLMLKLRPLK